ncbi:glycosyltransferase family 4 protein [Microbacterium invictum]|uniref:D-inositol 3-phosphate glycosyltransferase n=1 Tax=Microbacterium invictum TaxID=515415 RepID=A0ABZ0VBS1_9MICO|nr:glycosyltransferase family 4 protein [Microbacterium invictum]WQB70247.1 glycosyltransferase family 4 protein [Microbacterium invictum]
MHIVMFGDQHVESSGGAQVSMRLQRRFLERAGHTVTIVQPRLHARKIDDPASIDLPSVPVTLDREYGLTLPTRAADRAVDAGMAGRPPVDVVHVQGDFWGAILGHRFAARHALPLVHTMHNRVDVGIAATTPFPRLALRLLNAWAGRAILPREPREAGTDGWAYLRRFAARAAAVTAPSSHFAHRLMAHHVRPGGSPEGQIDVVWNGIDDEMRDAAGAAGPLRPASSRPRLVWVGRMSPEKRLLPFLDALADSGVAADVTVIGGGGQARAARRLVARRRPAARVTFAGRLPYAETLRLLSAADAVVQSSIGFETQGMTVFEAASLGTPAIVADPDIADELGEGVWRVGSEPDAFALTLRDAVGDISAGRARQPAPEIADTFRQSSRTAAMVAVYDRVRRR